MERKQHAREGGRLADEAERLANTNANEALVSAVALQSIAHSLAAIADSLTRLVGENGVIYVGDTNAV